jgi:serine/threonine-protein kinase
LSISDDAPSTKAPIVERARVANADTPRSVDPVRRRSDEPARVAASTRRVGRLGFAVSPWGEIYVDGRRRGVSPPLREIELPPGKYLIEIRNTAFPVRRQAIDVNARTRLRIKHKFK